MIWKNGRPEHWKESKKLGDAELNDDNYLDNVFEAGANAMHKADIEFLEQFPEVIFRIKASMTKEAWLAFIG